MVRIYNSNTEDQSQDLWAFVASQFSGHGEFLFLLEWK